jgi:cardiolipin synthase
MITALIIIGILAVILTLVAWFTPWSEPRVETTSTTPLALGTPAFFTAIESITNSPMLPLSSDGIKILNNGDQFIPDLLKEVGGAQHSITITNYIFKKGDLLNPIIRAMTERAKAGVEVRVLMDGKGSLFKPKEEIEDLKKAGGKVTIFRPIFDWRSIMRGNKRTHVRAIVIDGKVAYTGGAALEDGWLGNGLTPDIWRDEMFKFNGLGARSIQNIFNDLWRQTTGEILSGESFYPENNETVTLPCTDKCFTTLFHAPTPDLDKNLSQLLWLSTSGATDHIYMETPYLLPDKNMLQALTAKAKSGVNVEIIVPGPYIDSKIVQAASRSYYEEVLNAGIHIYEYQPAHIHSKIFTADEHWSVVGSANLDNRSETLNLEDLIAVEDKDFAQGLEQQFLLDKSHATEIKPGSYQTNKFTQFFGRISRLFAKQY